MIKVSLLCEYGVGGSGDETISCKLEAAGHQAGTAHPKIHWISTDFDQKFVKTLSHLNVGWVSQILNKIWGNGAHPKIQWISTDFDQILWKHFQHKSLKALLIPNLLFDLTKNNFRWEFCFHFCSCVCACIRIWIITGRVQVVQMVFLISFHHLLGKTWRADIISASNAKYISFTFSQKYKWWDQLWGKKPYNFYLQNWSYIL